MGHCFQRPADLRQSDPFHMWAEIAWLYEIHRRMVDRNVIRHRAFRQQYDPGWLLASHIIRHVRGGASEVGFRDDLGRAFRMRQNDHAGIIGAQGAHFSRGETFMDFAVACPGYDFDVGLGGDVLGEVFIGKHDDLGHTKRFHDSLRVARGAADIRLRLYGGG